MFLEMGPPFKRTNFFAGVKKNYKCLSDFGELILHDWQNYTQKAIQKAIHRLYSSHYHNCMSLDSGLGDAKGY